MAQYDVTFTRTETMTFRVEADSEQQAREDFLSGDEVFAKTLDLTVTGVEVVPQRAEPIIIREGASQRTGDELGEQFILDALSLDPQVLSASGRVVFDQAQLALSEASHIDDDDLRDALNDLVRQVESHLGDHVVVWNDGYTIEPYVEGVDYSND